MDKKFLILYLLLFVLITPVLFINLGKQPLYVWDEARVAVNAVEMLQDKNFIVTSYEGLPDLWNTKPPLLIWMQCLSIKLFGYNEFAVRLPSAIAALCTCVVLALFFAKRNYHLIAFLSCLILISQESFTEYHAARAADYDVLLTLFTTCYVLSFFAYLESKKSKYIFLTSIFIGLSVLCKGVAGLLFTPALFIYSIFRRETLTIFKERNFYFGLGISFITVATYYLLREHYNPGYLHAVWNNELGGRSTEAIEGHVEDWDFYIKNLSGYHFSYHWYYLLLSIPAGILIKDKFINRLTIYLTLTVVFYLTVISSAATKLIWYDIPLLPLLSIMASICLYFIYYIIARKISVRFSDKYSIAVAILLTVAVLIHPYSFSLRASINAPLLDIGPPEAQHAAELLKELTTNKPNLVTKDTLYLCYPDYYSPFNFYEKVLKINGITMARKTNLENLSLPAFVIVPREAQQEYIKKNYNYSIELEKQNVKLLKIINKY